MSPVQLRSRLGLHPVAAALYVWFMGRSSCDPQKPRRHPETLKCTNFVEVPGLWSAQVPHDCPGRSTGFPRGRNTHPHGGRSGKGIHSPARAWPKSQPKPLQCWTPNVGIYTYGGFHKLGVPQNLWFIMENPIKMDDLEVPPFQEETSIFGTIFWAVSNVHCMRGMG